MNFTGYDIILLILFVMIVSFFLYRKRANLKKEGLLFLYKTKWGMKLIDKIGTKYQKTLKLFQHMHGLLGLEFLVQLLDLIQWKKLSKIRLI